MPKLSRFQLEILDAMVKLGASIRDADGGVPELSIDLFMDFMGFKELEDGLRIEMELFNLNELGYVTVREGNKFLLNSHRFKEPM